MIFILTRRAREFLKTSQGNPSDLVTEMNVWLRNRERVCLINDAAVFKKKHSQKYSG